MNSAKSREALKFVMIFAWLGFTVVFALWWLRLSTDHISLLAKLDPSQLEHWDRQRNMLFWEGSSWIVLLVLGGAALIMLVLRERSRVRRIREFFASFSHEIKTSLASLRIQAEALQDDFPKTDSPILDRLIGDTVRLQLQLENSLFLASQDNLQLFLQPLSIEKQIAGVREQWPGLKVELNGRGTIEGDDRALRTILSNFLQNAIVHGKASQVTVESKTLNGKVEILISDNGSGFGQPVDSLGKLFHRPKPTSGSGIGLYISRLLCEKMKGEMSILPSEHGFKIRLLLPGAAK